MAKKESTVVYDKHVEICAEYLTDEQFGRLMFALVKEGEPDFGDDALLSMAYAFISLQKKMDDEKYARICERNRQNGALGGAPKGNQNARKKDKNNPKQPNWSKNNPNDNDEVNDNEKDKNNDEDARLSQTSEFTHDDFLSFGSFQNVELTETEHDALVRTYERTGELIEKVSVWLRSAKNPVPDHYGLCIKFATNDQWPKRRQIEPVEEITIDDPLSEEEQERRVADMRARLNVALG